MLDEAAPPETTGLGNKLEAWIEADKKQNQKQGEATLLRTTIKEQLDSITDRRLKNYPVRRLFHLTLNRPFDG